MTYYEFTVQIYVYSEELAKSIYNKVKKLLDENIGETSTLWKIDRKVIR